ncbi:MAG: hypothetical protein J0L64_15190 [Acidobacteria bacterium]|nr:hypothetical protein [Acidobacteriota bacterium]
MRRLLIRPGALGDCIASLPALEALSGDPLRGDYTEVWTAAAHVPLMRFANVARALSSTGLDLLELGLAPATLRDELRSFDSIVSWYGATRPEFRAAVSELPVHFFPALPSALPTGAGLTACEFYSRQAESLGARVAQRTPRLPVERAASLSYAVIHPFSGSARKNWPLDRFLELAAQLTPPVVFTAGPEEEMPAAGPSRRFAQRRFHNVWALAQWMGNAAFYIGNDSGPSHLAAAAGAPVVAIFGPSDERVWAPPGARVVRSHSDDPWPSVDEVLAACVKLPGCTDENSSWPRSAGG